MNVTPFKLINGISDEHPQDEIFISIVIPIFNEEENIPVLYKELNEALIGIGRKYEILFVNDGSVDGSGPALCKIADCDENVKILQFRKQYGQSAALSAGFKYAKGDVIITMDGDLQNDPADIKPLLQKMSEGYDMVNGWRKNRCDRYFARKLPSKIANWVINFLISGTGVHINDFGCTLKAYKKGIIKNITLYGEMHRFTPVFAAWLGSKIIEIPVNHRPRIHGCAKYNLSRVSRVIFDLIVVRFFADYLTRPIQFFGRIAKIMTRIAAVTLLLLILLKTFYVLPISINTLIIIFGLMIFTVLQFISIGLLGEIMIRAYFESGDKYPYVIKEILCKREEPEIV